MNAGFFENLLLSLIVTFAILAVSYIAGEVLVRPQDAPAPAMTAAKPDAAAPKTEKPRTAAADLGESIKLGKKLYAKCKACHTANKGGRNKLGPNLWNIVGRAKASVDGFKYSDALKGLDGDWTAADLDGFLENPKAYAKGTRMSFAGIRAAGDRAALIAYLRSLGDNPVVAP